MGACLKTYKNTEYAPDSLWNWFPVVGQEKGGLTKSYYAGQDVLIVLRPSDAEGNAEVSAFQAKIEINQVFTSRPSQHYLISGLLAS